MMNRSGFTLVEMMVAISILAILAAIAIPNGISWMGNARINSAGRQVYAAIQDARMHAIKANANTTIEFSAAGDSYETSKWDPQALQMNQQTHTLPAGVQVAATTFPGRVLTYNGRGFGSTGNVDLTNNSGRTIQISVNVTGRPRVAY